MRVDGIGLAARQGGVMTRLADRARMPGAAQSRAGGSRVHRSAPHVPRPPWAPVQRMERHRSASAEEQSGPAPAPNRTGLPDRLKAGVEALSGLAMDDVRVQRNSAEPAKLGALAYTQGSDIHLGPGHEQHLPHEAWHVVQQKQGRVAATTQMMGLQIDVDRALEAEADALGQRAKAAPPATIATAAPPLRTSADRLVMQLQKNPKTKEDDGPSNLAEQVSWKKEYKHKQTLPAHGFDLSLSFTASATFEHKALKAAAEALTQAKIKQGETTVGVELNLKAQDIRKLVASLWKKELPDKILHPEKMSSSIETKIGAYNFETKMSPVPLTIETAVTPAKDIIIELGQGFRAVVGAEFTIKAVQKEEPRVRIKEDPLPETSPWPYIVAGLLALLAFIAEYWWVPVLII